MTVFYENIVDWRDMKILDRDGHKLGKLKDVYVDVETDDAMFGSVKKGFVDRHLTFVPLDGSTLTPKSLQVAVSKEQVRQAPTVERDGDELSQDEEKALFHHYELNYTPPATPRGRRLARR